MWRCQRLSALWVAGLWVLCWPLGARGDDSDAAKLKEMKIADRQRVLADWKDLPVLPEQSIRNVLTFKLVDGRLQVESGLAGKTLVNARIPLSDLNGDASIVIGGAGSGVAAFLQFQNWDFSDPSLIEDHIQVQSIGGRISLNHDTEYFNHTETVTLQLDNDPTPAGVNPAAPGATLRIQGMGVNGDAQKNDYYAAPSMEQLRKQHPEDYDRYVRPIFRALRQESVIGEVDDKTAWQVLSDGWTADPALAAKVNEIVAQLNADDYAARAEANKKLAGMGEPAALYLMSSTIPSLTAEQQGRIDQFLVTYRPLNDEQVKSFRKNVDFLIDCLTSNDETVRTLALTHLSKAVGHDVQFDVKASPEAQGVAIDKLRDELTAKKAN